MTDLSELPPIAEGKRLVAFGDLNCPFCYALEERLQRKGATDDIEWRLVEHAPALPKQIADATDAEQTEVGQELAALVVRAPDVEINRPPFRPASGPAIRAVAAAARVDQPAADRLRVGLFRALWVEGRNIANPDVIRWVATEARVELPVAAPNDAETARTWTAQWRGAQFNRIPSLVSANDVTLLGLAEEKRLDLFLRSGLFGSRTADACVVKDE